MREFSAPWRAALACTLLGAVLTLTVALPIASALRNVPIRVDASGPLELFAGQALLALFLAAWFALQDRSSAREFFHVPQHRWATRIATGVGVGVVGWVLTIASMSVFALAARGARVEPQQGFVDVVVWIATQPLLVRVALILAAMTIEEAFFRAFLQPRFGIVTATLCFALAHVNYGSPAMGAGVFVIGWILGSTFRRYDDVVVCAVAHGTFDAIQLLIVLPLVAAHL